MVKLLCSCQMPLLSEENRANNNNVGVFFQIIDRNQLTLVRRLHVSGKTLTNVLKHFIVLLASKVGACLWWVLVQSVCMRGLCSSTVLSKAFGTLAVIWTFKSWSNFKCALKFELVHSLLLFLFNPCPLFSTSNFSFFPISPFSLWLSSLSPFFLHKTKTDPG